MLLAFALGSFDFVAFPKSRWVSQMQIPDVFVASPCAQVPFDIEEVWEVDGLS